MQFISSQKNSVLLNRRIDVKFKSILYCKVKGGLKRAKISYTLALPEQGTEISLQFGRGGQI